MSEYRNKEVTLPDQRQLGYAEFGNADGAPVFYLHGWPACRLEAFLYSAAAVAANVRLIAVDRPGFGLSSFQTGRTLLDWPTDLIQLADQLELDQFYLLGHSGGGPYAAASAYRIPDRLLGTSIVAGLSPMTNRRTREGMRMMNQILLTVGRRFPWILNKLMEMTRKMSRDPEKLKQGLKDLPDVDRELIIEHLPIIVGVMEGAFSQGTRGATHEGRIYASPWGFELSEITIPVTLWQGTLDVNVPLSNGQIYAEEIPEATLHLVDGEGHFSLPFHHGETILKDLVAPTP